MKEGSRKVTTAGKTGYVVDSVRTVSVNGEVVRNEKLTRSTYKMMPTEVTVGTMPVATPAPTEVPASAEVSEVTASPTPDTTAVTDTALQTPQPSPVATEEPTAEEATIETTE